MASRDRPDLAAAAGGLADEFSLDDLPVGERSATAALIQHARRSEHRPFLFYREGFDWRWLSFAAVAHQALAGAALLDEVLGAESKVPEAQRGGARDPEALDPRALVAVPFVVDSHARPEAFAAAVVADLAVQMSGRISLPLVVSIRSPEQGARDVPRSVLEQELELPPEASPRLVPESALPEEILHRWSQGEGALLPMPPPPGRFDRIPPLPGAIRGSSSGGFVYRAPRGDEGQHALQRAPAAAADALHNAPPRLAGEQPILPWSWAPETHHARRVLTWATLAGAALLLEPDQSLWPEVAAWARPTHLAAPSAALDDLFEDYPVRWGRRWPWRREQRLRKPWDRLLAVAPMSGRQGEAEDGVGGRGWGPPLVV
ncbi:MAG: hypothetical protein AAGD01_08780 [Acidobacteriota bacterium]